jgi:hypothetical protein
MTTSIYMRTLRADPQFRAVIDELTRRAPLPIKYDAKKDNFREVIYGQALAEGFLLAIRTLETI